MMKLKNTLIFCLFLPLITHAQAPLDSLVPIRGLCLKAPDAEHVERFVRFIDEELGAMPVNLLILRIDYNYQYTSRPEFFNPDGLSKANVRELVSACERQGIRLIPQINLFGHQSWHSDLGPLLTKYPEFDETPDVRLPEVYQWPNEDGLYCKSYCPLHPGVHRVVFDLVDEILEVFDADAFHAGLDEVFYIGMDQCPRCRGRDKAWLFAGEVTRIRNHLARQGIELWMWGDRLLDGVATGLGMWEASMNNTHKAIDMIPGDVVICDWHYETAVPTAAYFAAKGFRVLSCPWRKVDVALSQLEQTLVYRKNATPAMKGRFLGMLHTIWTSNEAFLDLYYGIRENRDTRGDQAGVFKALFEAIKQMENK